MSVRFRAARVLKQRFRMKTTARMTASKHRTALKIQKKPGAQGLHTHASHFRLTEETALRVLRAPFHGDALSSQKACKVQKTV